MISFERSTAVVIYEAISNRYGPCTVDDTSRGRLDGVARKGAGRQKTTTQTEGGCPGIGMAIEESHTLKHGLRSLIPVDPTTEMGCTILYRGMPDHGRSP